LKGTATSDTKGKRIFRYRLSSETLDTRSYEILNLEIVFRANEIPPPIQCVPGVKGWVVKLTTHLHLVSKLGMRGAIPPLSMAWCLVKHTDNFSFTFAANSIVLYKQNISVTLNIMHLL